MLVETQKSVDRACVEALRIITDHCDDLGFDAAKHLYASQTAAFILLATKHYNSWGLGRVQTAEIVGKILEGIK
jgi:hypothetical protein